MADYNNDELPSSQQDRKKVSIKVCCQVLIVVIWPTHVIYQSHFVIPIPYIPAPIIDKIFIILDCFFIHNFGIFLNFFSQIYLYSILCSSHYSTLIVSAQLVYMAIHHGILWNNPHFDPALIHFFFRIYFFFSPQILTTSFSKQTFAIPTCHSLCVSTPSYIHPLHAPPMNSHQIQYRSVWLVIPKSVRLL